MYTVYKHTAPNGKVYIGITGRKPEKRWDNGNGYKGNEHFYRAIRKYTWKNFKHDILETGLTKEQACDKEIELIAYYDSTNPDKGYNHSIGGDCSATGARFTEERRKNASEKTKELWADEKYRAKVIEAHKGYKPTKEELQKRSEGLKKAHKEGKYNNVDFSFFRTEEYRKTKSNELKELWNDEAHKKVFLETLTRIQHDPEARRKAIEQLKITNNKPEIKAKFSGKNNGKSKQVRCIETGKMYTCVAQASKKTGASYNGIAMCCRGERQTAGGYHWKYAD